ncbi:MAG: hypothetical protein D6734_02800 [Candidatus Schekmanbacteria bacterium]|nr:MAG: hypothetical protein D6734_02800 [Candidatus Schekmanbacteria bacterium]
MNLKSFIVAVLIVAFALQPFALSFAADKTFAETKGLERAYWITGSALTTPVWTSLKTLYSIGGLGAGFITLFGSLGVAHKTAKKIFKNSLGGDWYVSPDYLMGNKKQLDIYGRN